MRSRRDAVYVGILFAAAFVLGPLRQLGFLERMPGDFFDARFNACVLENIFQYLTGHGRSLWDPGFYYPFPFVGAFSDNLYGAAPVYVLARAATLEPDTAFQTWFLASYCANFLAMYFVLGRFGASTAARCVGALVFTFALPVSGQVMHAQLAYRFAVPLAIGAFAVFLERNDVRDAFYCAAWLTWQFYCSIYLGFFTLLFIFGMGMIDAIWRRDPGLEPRRRSSALAAAGFAGLGLLMAALLYPYVRVTQLYGFVRTYLEIGWMLPRPGSYLVSDESWLWSTASAAIAGLPVRNEHQLFVGAVPLVLAALGVLRGQGAQRASTLIAGAWVLIVAITLSLGGISAWRWISALPLASAMRAVSRVELVLLFPAGFFAARGLDVLRERRRVVATVAVVLLLVEALATTPLTVPKARWRESLAQAYATLPGSMPPEPILFFAQDLASYFADFDAMWISVQRGIPTLNGYSGWQPPGYTPLFGRDCAELPRRIHAYLAFSGQEHDPQAYTRLAARVVPIGFRNCDLALREAGNTP